jgi:hypothetical protein
MNVLNKLIADKTKIKVEYNDEEMRDLTGIIIDYHVEDYYFHEKGESIYITVNIDPLDDYIEGEEWDTFTHIPLGKIKLANK